MQFKRGLDGHFAANLPKKDYLLSIQRRLKEDVEPYLNLIKEKGGHFGFWAMIRLLMPVVEAVGSIKYPNRNSAISGSKVLADLHLPYPKLSWLLFRTNLLHGDELTPFINEQQERFAGWGISIGGGHSQRADAVEIDVEELYLSLFDYIGKLAREATNEEIVLIRAMYISDTTKDQELLFEYNRLFAQSPVSPR